MYIRRRYIRCLTIRTIRYVLTVLWSRVGDDNRTQKHQEQSGAGHDQRGSPRTRRDGCMLVNATFVHRVLIVSCKLYTGNVTEATKNRNKNYCVFYFIIVVNTRRRI